MRIGLYFGSFNPIHTGHLIIASRILSVTDLEKIWFVVSPHNPHKETHTLLNEYDRLHLVELAIADNPSFKASNAEFHLPRPSYTIDTLTYLTEKFPGCEFSVIIGSDSFANIHRWKNYEALIAQHRLIVYLRPGFPAVNATGITPAFCIDTPLLDISATYIRNEIREGHSIRYLVPDPVEAYISSQQYYRK